MVLGKNMDLGNIWWIWIIIGVIFLFIELLTTTFFGLWMAIAALFPAMLGFIKPDISTETQVIAWIIAMIVCAWLWYKYSKPDAPLKELEDALIGQIGVLAKGCDTKNTGIILLQKPVAGSTQWQCIANQGIPSDTRVIVIEQINDKLLRVNFEKNPNTN